MINPQFTGTIKDGTLSLDNPDRFIKYLSNLKSSEVVMTVKPKRRVRTSKQPNEKTNQNGYYWKIIIPILGDYFGYNPDEIHQALKVKFLRIGGTDQLLKIGSTAKLSTTEWEDLMERIRVWALTDYQIEIPTVGDYYSQYE